MSGGFVSGPPARVRIKGRAWSCIRFCLIAVSFMMAWVLISSELGYYSKWLGPKILLELSIAFNVPAIPVLIISGQVEKVLDRQLGPTMSMAIRLLFGLAGCTACAAAFPFMAHTHAALLWIVAVLGMLSAIAFSTSYQLVQWFRHADIIALGIGGVGTGPLVLMLQLFLEVGPSPLRWQWIAMFEVTAAIMVLGLVSAVSLFAQYWKVLTGEEEYLDPRQPLLPEQATDSHGSHHDNDEESSMRLARATTEHVMLPPDPTSYGVSAVLGHGAVTWPDEDERGVPTLRRVGSGSDLVLVSARRVRPYTIRQINRSSSAQLPSTRSASPPTTRKQAVAMTAESTAMPPWPQPATEVVSTAANGASYGQGASAWHAASNMHHPHVSDEDTDSSFDGRGPSASSASGLVGVVDAGDPSVLKSVVEGDGGEDEGGSGEPRMLTLKEETIGVMQGAWQVLLAFLISVTVTYIVFPFFTYVQSSGLFGDELPKVLFFGRIFADLIGRFAPRRKELMIHSPNTLASIALLKVVLCVLFFVYIKAPGRFHHDVLSMTFVLLLWLLGGYINTSANIMAPACVQPALVGRASALLALIFQVGHFAGLVIAVLLAYLLYGDMIG